MRTDRHCNPSQPYIGSFDNHPRSFLRPWYPSVEHCSTPTLPAIDMCVWGGVCGGWGVEEVGVLLPTKKPVRYCLHPITPGHPSPSLVPAFCRDT